MPWRCSKNSKKLRERPWVFFDSLGVPQPHLVVVQSLCIVGGAFLFCPQSHALFFHCVWNGCEKDAIDLSQLLDSPSLLSSVLDWEVFFWGGKGASGRSDTRMRL